MPKQAASGERKKRDIHRQKALYRYSRYHRERARFFATVNGVEMGERGKGGGDRHAKVGEQTTTISGFARTRIAVVSIARLPLFLISPFLSFVFVLRLFLLLLLLLLSFFFFSFVRCPLESIPLDSFLTLAIGRPIATSADSALLRIYLPTYSRSTSSCGGQGEPDLSPLNGINKLYYACTSP